MYYYVLCVLANESRCRLKKELKHILFLISYHGVAVKLMLFFHLIFAKISTECAKNVAITWIEKILEIIFIGSFTLKDFNWFKDFVPVARGFSDMAI